MPRRKARTRPVVIIQNDTGNRMSATVIVATITSRRSKRTYPVNVTVPEQLLPQPSEVRTGQIHTLDKSLLGSRIAHLSPGLMSQVDDAINVSLGLPRSRPGL